MSTHNLTLAISAIEQAAFGSPGFTASAAWVAFILAASQPGVSFKFTAHIDKAL